MLNLKALLRPKPFGGPTPRTGLPPRAASPAPPSTPPPVDAKARLEGKYELGRVLGSGKFATVRLVTDHATGKKYAGKAVDRKKIKKEADVREEVAVLSKVDHPHLAHIYERIETPTDIWLVLDLAEGGELLQHIMSRAPFEEADGAHITRQIVEGIEYLHRLGIVHRDLKPENILFKDPGSHDILITDFGFSRIVGSARCLETICGTPSYMAPEILSGSGHGLEVDMWAIGCITYAMLSGFLPFAADSQVDLFALIRSASFSFPDDLFSDVSSEAKDFISRCLVVAVGARPGSWDPVRIRAKEALRHPWLDIGAKLLDADPGDSMKISTARCKAPASLVLVVA